MSAYATARMGRNVSSVALGTLVAETDEPSMLDVVIENLVGRIAEAVVSRMAATHDREVPEWLDSRGAAEYLGVHRDTLRKLAAERTIPAHQDGRGCKLFFRRSDLDEWRRAGGRAVQLASIVAEAA